MSGIDVNKLKPGDRFAGVIREVHPTASRMAALEGGVLGNDDRKIIFPPGTKMNIGQLGLFEFVKGCDLCNDSGDCLALLVNLVGDEHTWETQ